MSAPTSKVIDQGTTIPRTAAPVPPLPPLPPELEGATIAAIVWLTRMTVCSLVLVMLDLPGTATTTTSVVVYVEVWRDMDADDAGELDGVTVTVVIPALEA